MTRSTSKLSMGEQNLHRRFQHFGRLHLRYRRKCIGLIPQIWKQQIYLKKGYESIFEYAAKLAGLSKEQVKRVLYLAEKFADKESLKKCMENGEIGTGKLAKIASVVTVENQQFWLNQAKILNTRALETLVRDERLVVQNLEDLQISTMPTYQQGLGEAMHFDGLLQAKEAEKFVHVNKSSTATIEKLLQLNLTEEVVVKLFELQSKGHDINKIILELLEKRANAIAKEKEEIAQTQNGEKGTASRYIPVKIKRLLQKEYGSKCSIPSCSHPTEEIHHTQRFKLGQNHHPSYMAPLCKQHHQIAHSIDLRYQAIRMQTAPL